ncbi:MAG: Kdo2-lipid IVA lauroyltransferase [Desulfobacteraceae bacterium Eth-SRB1]|nr:MAG: Kdo2-lipid IVA lauroyltransferase [Desulfobacteraceae bacterium Eth-SRB1]
MITYFSCFRTCLCVARRLAFLIKKTYYKTIKHKGVITMKINLSSFLQLRFNIFMCKKIGWKITFFYITCLGRLYFFFNRKEKQKIKSSVKEVFAGPKSRSEIRSITRDIFRGIVSHYYEKFFNAYSSPETLRAFVKTHMESTGTGAIERGLSRGRGVLLITGHVGGIELIPAFLCNKKYPVTMIVRFSSAHMRNTAMKQSNNFSTRIIDADNTPNVIKAIFDNLKENRVVLTQCDEIDEWRPSKNNIISFLGKKINLDRTMNIISKRGGTSVVFGVMHRNYNHRYKFIGTSIEEIKKQFKQLTGASVGEIVLKYLEQYIYKHPEGWYQWKKYPAMKEIPSSGVIVEQPLYLPQLRPFLGRLA